MKKNCKLRECKKEFAPRYPNQTHCSPAHANRNRVRRHYKNNREKILAGKKADRSS